MVALKKNVPATNGAESAKVVFSAKAKAAIHSEAMLRLANGKQAIKMLRPHIEAYRADRTYVDNVRPIIEAVVNEYNTNKRPEDRKMAAPRKERDSEFRRRVRIADWKCCDDVLDYFEENTMTENDILFIAQYLDGVAKTAKAPPREKMWEHIVKKRAEKTGRTTANGDAKPVARDASKAVDDTNKLVAGWRNWVASQPALKKHRAEANELLGSILKAASELALLAKTAA
jgi:hypothetical protein